MTLVVPDVNCCSEFTQVGNVVGVSEVAAGYFVTHAEKNSGDAAHARAADANEVNSAEVFWHRL